MECTIGVLYYAVVCGYGRVLMVAYWDVSVMWSSLYDSQYDILSIFLCDQVNCVIDFLPSFWELVYDICEFCACACV